MLRRGGDFLFLAWTLRESRFDRKTNTLAYFDFQPADHQAQRHYDNGTIRFGSSQGGPSWYLKAAEAGRPIWIDARTIRKGAETVAGVSFAAPFYGPEGELRGVTTVDFDIVAVSSFLAANPVGKAGFAFIIETPAQGKPHIIAHPTPGILTRTVIGRRGTPRYEFVPAGELSDGRVARFMEELSRGDREGRGDGLRRIARQTESIGRFELDCPPWGNRRSRKWISSWRPRTA